MFIKNNEAYRFFLIFLKKMKLFSNNIDDLIKIESIILNCYGQYGKSALIQPDRYENSSLILTNDARTILDSIKIKNNHLYYLINRLIKDYNQDGTKNLFIYLVNASRIILKPENSLFPLDELKSAFKQLNIPEFIQIMTNEWIEIMAKNENFIQLAEINDIMVYFKKMCVFQNLETFNLNLSRVCKNLISEFVNVKLKNEEKCFSEYEKDFRESLDDFSFIVEYCDIQDLDQSKILQNQFLIDRKFGFCSRNLAKGAINSIFVLKQENVHADIEISANLNSVLTKIKEDNRQIKFSQDFLKRLSENNINLIFFEGFLSETKKNQLKSIECSFIDYVPKERIVFLTERLRIGPIYSEKTKFDSCTLRLDCFEILNENLIAFRISKQTNLSFILFCSQIKLNFVNFKIYFKKCLTSLIKLISKQNEFCGVLVKSFYFERKCIELLPKIVHSDTFKDKKIGPIEFFVCQLFQVLLIKFKKLKNFRQLFEIQFNENVYEVLSLKHECFIKCLYFTQSILNIDSIYYVNSIKN